MVTSTLGFSFNLSSGRWNADPWSGKFEGFRAWRFAARIVLTGRRNQIRLRRANSIIGHGLTQ